MIFEQFSRISIFVRKMLTMFELQSKNPFSVSELFLNLLCIIFQSYEMFIDANQSRKVNPIEIMTQIKKSKNNQTKKTGKIRLQKRVGNQRPYFPFFSIYIYRFHYCIRHAIMIFSPTLSLCFTMLLIGDSLLIMLFLFQLKRQFIFYNTKGSARAFSPS